MNPGTGVHSNTIEESWAGIKRKVPVRNRTTGYIDVRLLEFLWRQKNANDLWAGFIGALKEIEYMYDQ